MDVQAAPTAFDRPAPDAAFFLRNSWLRRGYVGALGADRSLSLYAQQYASGNLSCSTGGKEASVQVLVLALLLVTGTSGGGSLGVNLQISN